MAADRSRTHRSATLERVEPRLGLALLLVLTLCAPLTSCCGGDGAATTEPPARPVSSAEETPETTGTSKPVSAAPSASTTAAVDTSPPKGVLEAYIRAQ